MAPQSKDYSESTVDELMDMARERGITGISSMRKQDLIEALESGDGGGDSGTDARGDSRDSDARSKEDGSEKDDGAMSDRDERRRAS